jgi:hypothetical protein
MDEVPGLAQMAQNNPYGGKSMAEIVDAGGVAPSWDPETIASWASAPATHEQVSAAITRGGRYQPDYGKTVQSSGPEGGWFSIPGTQPETQVPSGQYYNSDPAPGLFGMSTNNPRLLPRGWQQPGYIMRAGHVIDSRWLDKPLGYVNYRGGGEPPFGTGGPGHGFPVSAGSSNQRGYFFPGQIEPWITEGGPGTT